MQNKRARVAIRRNIVIEKKLEVGACEACGLEVKKDNYMCFDWNHIDPTNKTFIVSRARYTTVDNILTEIAKCNLLCAVCHRLHTQESMQSYGQRVKSEVLPTLFDDDLMAF